MAGEKKAASNEGKMARRLSVWLASVPAMEGSLFTLLSRAMLFLSLAVTSGDGHRVPYDPLKDPDYWQGQEIFTDMERTDLQQYTQKINSNKHYVYPEFVRGKLRAESIQPYQLTQQTIHETRLTEINAPNTKESPTQVKTRRKRVHVVNTEQDKVKVVEMIKRLRKKKKLKKVAAGDVTPRIDEEEAALAQEDDTDTPVPSDVEPSKKITFTGIEDDAGVAVNTANFAWSSTPNLGNIITTTSSLAIDKESSGNPDTNTPSQITTNTHASTSTRSTISRTTPIPTTVELPTTSTAKTSITYLTKRETDMTLSAPGFRDGIGTENMKIFLAVHTTASLPTDQTGNAPPLMSSGYGGGKQAGISLDGKPAILMNLKARSPVSPGNQGQKKVVVALIDGDSAGNLTDFYSGQPAAGGEVPLSNAAGEEVLFRVVPAGIAAAESSATTTPATLIADPAPSPTWRILATATLNDGSWNRQITPAPSAASAGMPEEANRFMYMTADQPSLSTEQPPPATTASPVSTRSKASTKDYLEKDKGKFLIDSSEILKILMRQAFPPGTAEKKVSPQQVATKGPPPVNIKPIPAMPPVNAAPQPNVQKLSSLMQILEQHLKGQKGTKAERSLLRLYSALSVKFQNQTSTTTTAVTTTTQPTSTTVTTVVTTQPFHQQHTQSGKAMAPALMTFTTPAVGGSLIVGMRDPIDATPGKDLQGQSSGEQNKLDPILHMSQRTLDFMKQLLRKNKFDSFLAGRSIGSLEPFDLMPDKAPKPSFVNIMRNEHLFQKNNDKAQEILPSSSFPKLQLQPKTVQQPSQPTPEAPMPPPDLPSISKSHQHQRSAAMNDSPAGLGLAAQQQLATTNNQPDGMAAVDNINHQQQRSLVDTALGVRQHPGASAILGGPPQGPIPLHNLLQPTMETAGNLLQRRLNPLVAGSETSKAIHQVGGEGRSLESLGKSGQQLLANFENKKLDNTVEAIINEKTVNVHLPMPSGGAPELLQELFPTKASSFRDGDGLDTNQLLSLLKNHLVCSGSSSGDAAAVVRPSGHLDPALVKAELMIGQNHAGNLQHFQQHKTRTAGLGAQVGDSAGYNLENSCSPNEVCVRSYQKPDGQWVQEHVASFANEDQNGALMGKVDAAFEEPGKQRMRDLEFHPEPVFYRELHKIQADSKDRTVQMQEPGSDQQSQLAPASVFGPVTGDVAAESCQQQTVSNMQRRSDAQQAFPANNYRQQPDTGLSQDMDNLQINFNDAGPNEQQQQSEICEYHQVYPSHHHQQQQSANEFQMAPSGYYDDNAAQIQEVKALDQNRANAEDWQLVANEDSDLPLMMANVMGHHQHNFVQRLPNNRKNHHQEGSMKHVDYGR